MALFSQRVGLKPLQKAIQRESLDEELRNGLWNAVYERTLYNHDYSTGIHGYSRNLMNALWTLHFRKTIDTLPDHHRATQFCRDYFFKCEWNEALDFIEFIGKNSNSFSQRFREMCNIYMERESSAYRFVGNEVTEITSAHEIKSIEDAIGTSPRLAAEHLNTALRLLSDRQAPDYRNSIKESVSAIECICRLAASNDKATLGQALKTVSKKAPLHGAFESSLNALYGYTSDAAGIRHSLMEEASLTYSDAKFMLVASSGFVSYLIAKCAENGISLKK